MLQHKLIKKLYSKIKGAAAKAPQEGSLSSEIFSGNIPVCAEVIG